MHGGGCFMSAADNARIEDSKQTYLTDSTNWICDPVHHGHRIPESSQKFSSCFSNRTPRTPRSKETNKLDSAVSRTPPIHSDHVPDGISLMPCGAVTRGYWITSTGIFKWVALLPKGGNLFSIAVKDIKSKKQR